MADIKYKRIVFKLSGESLAGEQRFGINPEVVESITTNGRRTYNAEVVSIPGNYNLGEPDTARSERIAIVPPFGAEDAVKYILIAIVAIGVLGVGIFLIKRKVLRK